MPYITRGLQPVKRVDVIWDVYRQDSQKATTREEWSYYTYKSSTISPNSTKIEKEYHTEFLHFLAKQVVSYHMKGKDGPEKKIQLCNNEFMKLLLIRVHKKPKHFLCCMPLQVATRAPSSPEEVNGPHGMSLVRLLMSWLTCHLFQRPYLRSTRDSLKTL